MRRGRLDSRVLLFVLFLLLYAPFVWRTGFRLAGEHHTDFPTFYFAARAGFKVGISPYQQAFAGGFRPAGGTESHYVFPYLYPPPSLIVFYPYTWFGYETAKRIQLVASHLALLAILYLVCFGILGLRPFADRAERAPPNDALVLGAILVVTFLFRPLVETLRAGQTNVLAVLALVVSCYAVSRRRDALAGTSLALAGLLKTYPLLVALVFVFQRRWKALGWTIVGLAVSAGLASWALPRSAWSDWWTQVLPNARYGSTPEGLGSVVGPWNQSLAGFTSRLFVPNEFCEALLPSPFLARIAPYVLALAALLVTVWAALRPGRSTQHAGAPAEHVAYRAPTSLALQFAALLLLAFLIAPISWEHHLVFVLPSVYVALATIPYASRRRAITILIAAAVLAAPWPIQYDSYPGIAPWLQSGLPTLLISIKFFAALVLFSVLVQDLWGKKTDASS